MPAQLDNKTVELCMSAEGGERRKKGERVGKKRDEMVDTGLGLRGGVGVGKVSLGMVGYLD